MNTAAVSPTRMLTAAVVGAALSLLGCGQRAAALPPGFPDLDSFGPVAVDGYIATGPKGPRRFVAFSTPYNIQCGFTATEDPLPAGKSQAIHCEGDIPGVASGPSITESCATGVVNSLGAAGFRVERQLSGCPVGSYNAGTPLGVGQKLTYQNVTCAVGGDGLVACLDTSLGQHGFALKPSGNVTF
ncbi:hypothetical protein [Mycobacterium sp.]|uniref:hypothetical protein n=1 Tax=Mycobacterium sp. TaxID=1785 RepID=UPI0025F19675|nr:hypothetical protein [Mycobacterium sp.]